MSSIEGPETLKAPEPRRMPNPPTWSEADLLAGCRAGRRDAFDALVAAYYDRIYRLAWSMTGPEAASDLTQETFLAAVKALPAFRGDSQLGTWLISILRNQFLLQLRGKKKWKMASLSQGDLGLAAPEAPDLEHGVREILEHVKELPEELRTALVLFYVDGMKYAEIARAMECPIGTVRSRLFEARERVKSRVSRAETP
jgi:RNA polymerase sigma-70 factor (ECF subfamily)